MSFLKRRWREFAIWLVNSFFCGTRMFGFKRWLLNTCVDVSVGSGTKIVGPVNLGNCSRVSVGSGCWIGMGMTVYGDGSVCIGNNCDLAPDVVFITGSHEIGSRERRAGTGKLFHITVGNGCWLGARCAVTNSVAIHDAAVVGACALVNKDVRENCVVVGVPARECKQLDT